MIVYDFSNLSTVPNICLQFLKLGGIPELGIVRVRYVFENPAHSNHLCLTSSQSFSLLPWRF